MSLFWGEPWPDAKHAKDQNRRKQDGYLEELSDGALIDWRYHFGYEGDWTGAMKISYKGYDLRVFPHEFVVQTPKKMRAWVFGIEEGYPDSDPTHTLVENDTASAFLIRQALETDLKTLYDAALLDGCNPQMALAVAMGISIEDELLEFPNVGWYKPTPEVSAMYCYEEESVETDPPNAEELSSVKGELRVGHFGQRDIFAEPYE